MDEAIYNVDALKRNMVMKTASPVALLFRKEGEPDCQVLRNPGLKEKNETVMFYSAWFPVRNHTVVTLGTLPDSREEAFGWQNNNLTSTFVFLFFWSMASSWYITCPCGPGQWPVTRRPRQCQGCDEAQQEADRVHSGRNVFRPGRHRFRSVGRHWRLIRPNRQQKCKTFNSLFDI